LPKLTIRPRTGHTTGATTRQNLLRRFRWAADDSQDSGEVPAALSLPAATLPHEAFSSDNWKNQSPNRTRGFGEGQVRWPCPTFPNMINRAAENNSMRFTSVMVRCDPLKSVG
jgi:hypothetical protein